MRYDFGGDFEAIFVDFNGFRKDSNGFLEGFWRVWGFFGGFWRNGPGRVFGEFGGNSWEPHVAGTALHGIGYFHCFSLDSLVFIGFFRCLGLRGPSRGLLGSGDPPGASWGPLGEPWGLLAALGRLLGRP